MNRALRALCRCDPIPLALRRRVARAFVPYSGETYAMVVDGVTYRGRLDNDLEWTAWVTGRFYEYTYIGLIRLLRLGGCALDVGANVGNHALAFSTMFDEVIAFEPVPELFRRLQEKVAGRPNVRLHEVGLGSTGGTTRFSSAAGRNLGTGRVAASGDRAVTLVRGDDFLQGRHEHSIRFIKIDVEGHEPEVLSGLAGTLETYRPVVFYESFRTAGRPRAEALAASMSLFPSDYEFWGLRGQTTFPVQRRVARPIRLTPDRLGRRYAYVLALPAGVGPDGP